MYREIINLGLILYNVDNFGMFAIIPQLGIEYRPTFRWAISLSVRAPLAIRSAGVVPGIQIPVTVHFAF